MKEYSAHDSIINSGLVNLDELTAANTAFDTLAELCNEAANRNYTPTILPWNDDRKLLADVFDVYMEGRGSSIRAYRGKSAL
jgi:hypothetical protein